MSTLGRRVALGLGVVAILAVVVVAAVLFLGGRADPGTVVTGTDDTLDGTTGTVLVPAGAIEVTVGDPVDSYNDEKAPRGGGFVPVRTEFDAQADPALLLGTLGGRPEATAMTLVSGSESYDLPAPYQVAGRGTTSGAPEVVYVAVDDMEDVAALRIDVTYDGLTQSMNAGSGEIDMGAAAGLYRLDRTVPTETCPDAGWAPEGARPDLYCTVTGPVVTPYDPEEGWAKDGRSWLFAGVDLRLYAVRLPVGASSVEYLPHGDATLSLSVDGNPAVRTVREGDTWGQQVFDVATDQRPHRLRIEATQDLEQEGDQPGPRDRTVTLHRDVPLTAQP